MTNLQECSDKARAVYEGDGVPPLLQQICQAYGLTIREVASIFQISKGHAEAVCKHRVFPSLELAVKMARYFEVTVEELFGWRIEDDGKRRPLVVQDPVSKRMVRMNSYSQIRGTMDLVSVAKGKH